MTRSLLGWEFRPRLGSTEPRSRFHPKHLLFCPCSPHSQQLSSHPQAGPRCYPFPASLLPWGSRIEPHLLPTPTTSCASLLEEFSHPSEAPSHLGNTVPSASGHLWTAHCLPETYPLDTRTLRDTLSQTYSICSELPRLTHTNTRTPHLGCAH